jgi:hypothetical protein
MRLLSYTQKKVLVASLNTTNISYTINGKSYNPKVLMENEDYPAENPFIVISFLPTSTKYGLSVGNFLSIRYNSMYSNYAYGEEEICVIRCFSRDDGLVKGREITWTWLKNIETYIKVYWNSLITNGSVDRSTVLPFREIPKAFIKKYYGHETSFKIITTNAWTNEPVSGAITTSVITGIEFTATKEE